MTERVFVCVPVCVFMCEYGCERETVTEFQRIEVRRDENRAELHGFPLHILDILRYFYTIDLIAPFIICSTVPCLVAASCCWKMFILARVVMNEARATRFIFLILG